MKKRLKCRGMAAGAAAAVLLALYALFMLNADRLYFLFSGTPYLAKIPESGFRRPAEILPMRTLLDHAPTTTPFEEGKSVRGQMAGVEAKKGKAAVRVLFRSLDALYELKSNRRSLWDGSEGAALNFYFSTANLEQGVYQMGLQLTDDRGKRFAWLNSFFEKRRDGPRKYVAQPLSPLPARVRRDLEFAIEDFDCKYQRIACAGWMRLAGADMNDFNAYLLFEDPAGVRRMFYVPLFTRPDLVLRHGDPRAANGGFRVRLSPAGLTRGRYAVSVVLQSRRNGEAFLSAQKRRVEVPLARREAGTHPRRGMRPAAR